MANKDDRFKQFQGPYTAPHADLPKREVDLATNRNAKMINILLDPTVNGMFLFYITGTGFSSSEGFAMPPGLNQEQIDEFESEFLVLFERYAKKAMRQT